MDSGRPAETTSGALTDRSTPDQRDFATKQSREEVNTADKV